jgi:chromate reductase
LEETPRGVRASAWIRCAYSKKQKTYRASNTILSAEIHLLVLQDDLESMADKKIRILGFAGSLRKGSYNKMALKVAAKLVPRDAEVEIFDLEGMPTFNQDLEQNPGPKVVEFKEKIRRADAILIVTPEYNYSIPGVLKNAIDCASRPYGDNAFEGKPVAVMGTSTGMLGTARAQYHLRQCFVFLNMLPINTPEVMIPYAQAKFDENGNLKNAEEKERIRNLLQTLVDWTKKLSK